MMLGAATAALFTLVFARGTALRGRFRLFLLNILLLGKFENLFTLGLFLFLFKDLQMMKMKLHFAMGKMRATYHWILYLVSTNHVAFVAFDEELVTVFQLVQLSLLDLFNVVLDLCLAPLLELLGGQLISRHGDQGLGRHLFQHDLPEESGVLLIFDIEHKATVLHPENRRLDIV